MLKIKPSGRLNNYFKLYKYRLKGKYLTIAYLVKGVTMQASGLCLKHKNPKTKYETIKLRVFYNKTYYDVILNVKNTKSTNYLVNLRKHAN